MRRFVVAFLLICGAARSAAAHDGPEHVIEAIDAEIARSGATADLLFRRACERRALRSYAAAEVDLNAALQLDAEFVPARFELARVLAQRGETLRAFTLIEPLVVAEDEALRAAATALRGELYAAQDDLRRAIADFTTAIALRPDVEWFLLRAEAQHAAGDDEARLHGLRDGWQRTASPVLQQAWCEALIALGGRHLTEADAVIRQELAEGRFHSAWLLRRARLRLASNDRTAAEADLRTALAELQTRLNPQRPDPTLVAERAAVCRLLGRAPPATAVDADD